MKAMMNDNLFKDFSSKTLEEQKSLYQIASNYARVYRSECEYPQAMKYYLIALDIGRAIGEEDSRLLSIYNDISTLYLEMGNYDNALIFCKNALNISEKEFDTMHPSTALVYNNLANVYKARGDYPLALEYYEKALMIRNKMLGTEHSDTATTYCDIADLYKDMGCYDKALEYYKKAQVIREKVFGTEHPDTAITYYNIAGVYQAMENYEMALDFYEKALIIQEKVLGSEHPDTVATYNSIDKLNDLNSSSSVHDCLHASNLWDNQMPSLRYQCDNQEYLNRFFEPLFLEEYGDNRVTLASMYVSPHLKGKAESVSECIMTWFRHNTRKTCMLLYGNAGSGKTSLITKIIADANQETSADKEYDLTANQVLTIALRNHYDEIDLNQRADEILANLFRANSLDILKDKLLILDGLDEICILHNNFDGFLFLNKMAQLRTGFHVLVTSREAEDYFHNPVDIIGLQIEHLVWTDIEVETWCSRYCQAKIEKKAWCYSFLSDYRHLPDEDENDYRKEAFYDPIILYICGNGEISLFNHNCVTSIYYDAFRKILLRRHLLGQGDYFELTDADVQSNLIAWQYTKELAYQMFLLDTLDLVDSNDPTNIRAIGLKNAKARTKTILKETYGFDVQDYNLGIKKELALCPFAKGIKPGGITFARKTAYKYFTAVKLYEDYFAKFNKSYFCRKDANEAAEDVMKTAIAAFRYKAIPEDIFQYLCDMKEAPFLGRSRDGFDADGFKKAFVHAMENGILDTLTIQESPKEEYLYSALSNNNSINKQIVRALRALIFFLTGHGFHNENDNNSCKRIRDMMVLSDQILSLNNWDLSGADLSGADLSGADLSNTNLSDTDLRYANLSGVNLSRANLSRANLSEANLKGANLKGATLKDAYLSEVELSRADLSNSNLSGANLSGADLFNTNLSDTDLSGTILRRAELCRAHLQGTDLSGADLSGADLQGADLQGAIYCSHQSKATIFPDGFNPKEHGMVEEEC